MASRRLATLVTSWSVVPLLLACGVDSQQCTAPEGLSRPTYVALGGNCGPITNPDMVPVAVGNRGASVLKVETRLNGQVATETVMKGCTMRVTQAASEMGRMVSKINGESIDIANVNELKGEVVVERWDATGVPACSGVYNAILTRNSTVVGAGTGTTAAGSM